MEESGSPLDIGLSQLQHLVDGQLSALNAIQTKVGVLLGFDVTTLSILFTLGEPWVSAHRAIAAGATALVLASLGIFSYAIAIRGYFVVPDPLWLRDRLNDPTVDPSTLEALLIGRYGWAFGENKKIFSRKFYLVNAGIMLMALGAGTYAVAVVSL